MGQRFVFFLFQVSPLFFVTGSPILQIKKFKMFQVKLPETFKGNVQLRVRFFIFQIISPANALLVFLTLVS